MHLQHIKAIITSEEVIIIIVFFFFWANLGFINLYYCIRVLLLVVNNSSILFFKYKF